MYYECISLMQFRKILTLTGYSWRLFYPKTWKSLFHCLPSSKAYVEKSEAILIPNLSRWKILVFFVYNSSFYTVLYFLGVSSALSSNPFTEFFIFTIIFLMPESPFLLFISFEEHCEEHCVS